MAHGDKRLVGKAGRNTRIAQRHRKSSAGASSESSCGFHRGGKLLPSGHDERNRLERFAKQVIEQIVHVSDEPRQPEGVGWRAKMDGHECHLKLGRRADEGGDVESLAIRTKFYDMRS